MWRSIVRHYVLYETALKQLDLETLVCTRGPNFPLSRLKSRLMCPSCGSRRVTVVFEPPRNAQVGSRGGPWNP